MMAICCAECEYCALPDDVSWECRLHNVEFRAPQYNMYTHSCKGIRSRGGIQGDVVHKEGRPVADGISAGRD